MKIDEFLSRLKGVSEAGAGKWVACCPVPAHNDSNPSMSVAVGDNGGILVHCHAGCSPEAIVGAMGLKMSDLMKDSPDRARTSGQAKKAAKSGEAPLPSFKAPKKKRPTKHVCYYDYQDAEGKAIFRVDRRIFTDERGGKTFWQFHPDPNNPHGWTFGVKSAGVERVPFHLPKILAAGKAGKYVVIVEGEKDVLTVEKLIGCCATCNPGGAGKWERGWGKYFEGVPKILIVADKDPEKKVGEKTGEEKTFAVGQRHACLVERCLRLDGYEGKIVKICVPDVTKDDGTVVKCKDFTDWAEAMAAAGKKVDKSAFLEAIKAFGQWPENWQFGDADLDDLPRAGKAARNSISSGDGQERAGEAARNSASSTAEEFSAAGRFGRPSPLSPSEKERWFVVDYQINAGKIARFEIGVNHFRFEGWKKSDNDDETKGKFVKDAKYSAMEGELTQFFGLAIGCCTSFDAHFKVSGPVRIALISSITLAWLRSRGRFFADMNNPSYETSLFFDSAQGVLYLLHSNEFSSFLATVADVNREDKLFKYMVSLIDDMALDSAITPRVVPSKEWDRRGGAIYISNGDSQVCKITGGKFELVPNGTDDVLFIRGATLAPWSVEDGPGVDPFKESMLFKLAALEKETDRMNCRLWWLNLFACHANKPILLVTGPKGSGKTRLLQGMKQFLGMREDGKPDDTVNDIDPTDKGLDAFWIIEDRGRFEIFDNYDSKIKWAENAFQTAATNGSAKRRELYKTSTLVTLSANAYMGVTSNNPIFTTEGGGLPDRIITARVGSGRKVSVGDELRKDIDEHRNQYMTWLVRTLMVALADDKPVDGSINRRHPDYGAFAVRCGRAFGDEMGAIHAMEAAELDKALLPLLNDTIAKEIVAVLRAQEPVGSMRFTATDMSDAIIKRFGDDESDENTKKIYGARRIGKAISKLEREFHVLFKWSSGPYEGRTRYDFTGLTPQGELVFGASSGGFGGFQGLVSEKVSQERAHAGEFSEINPTNPPNPPYARAQAHSDLSSVKGEDIGEVSDDDFDPEGFEL
ncbi:MAG: hypothetical protein IKQ17_05870 [Kiritimatiellae bacterium]|nr:hypothetical protein [Kiritimatiellia bacterium]